MSVKGMYTFAVTFDILTSSRSILKVSLPLVKIEYAIFRASEFVDAVRFDLNASTALVICSLNDDSTFMFGR